MPGSDEGSGGGAGQDFFTGEMSTIAGLLFFALLSIGLGLGLFLGKPEAGAALGLGLGLLGVALLKLWELTSQRQQET
jgi:hypothetical protein